MSPLLQKHPKNIRAVFGYAARGCDLRLGLNRRYLGQRRAVTETGTGAGWGIKTEAESLWSAWVISSNTKGRE